MTRDFGGVLDDEVRSTSRCVGFFASSGRGNHEHQHGQYTRYIPFTGSVVGIPMTVPEYDRCVLSRAISDSRRLDEETSRRVKGKERDIWGCFEALGQVRKQLFETRVARDREGTTETRAVNLYHEIVAENRGSSIAIYSCWVVYNTQLIV